MRRKQAKDNDTIFTAKQIRHTRKYRHLTQKQLAERSGVSEGYIRKIEAHEKEPTLPVLVSIAVALDVSLNSLWIDLNPYIEPEFSRKQNSYVPAVGGRLIDCAIKTAVQDKQCDGIQDVEEFVETELDISFGYYYEIKRGAKTPSFELLATIAEKLGVSLDELVFEKSDHNRH